MLLQLEVLVVWHELNVSIRRGRDIQWQKYGMNSAALLTGACDTEVSYHLPAFWCPFSMLSLSECFLFPFGSRLVGKMYREFSCFLAGGCPLSNPSGFPGVAFTFPRDKSFLLLPAAVACTAIRRPCRKFPPFLLVTDPPYVQPNRCSAEVNSGRLCLSLL